jgi:uncharacterized alkaline shock family protein YloU
MNEQVLAGQVQISEAVVSKIAGHAALIKSDVAVLVGSISEGIAKRLGGKNIPKGVSVSMDEHKTAIELRVIIAYGSDIRRVCRELQHHVHEAVEMMTGKSVIEVHVKVEGVSFKGASKENVIHKEI